MKTRVPFVVVPSVKNVLPTTAVMKKHRSATVSTRNGKTRIVDYGPQAHGFRKQKVQVFVS